MKPSSRCPRTPTKLSNSLLNQLNHYSIAACAAGVGLLPLGQSAQGEVVYTATHKWLPLDKYLAIDLNHDGLNDLYFYLFSQSSFYNGTWLRMLQVKGRARVYTVRSNSYVVAAAFPKGAKIGPGHGFQNHPPVVEMFAVGIAQDGTIVSQGPWRKVKKQAYLGLRFAIKGKAHYGWARLGQISYNKPPRALLTGYAYETIPNKPIIAGATKESDDAGSAASLDTHTPAPGTLGALALGAPGLSIWRREESVGTAAFR